MEDISKKVAAYGQFVLVICINYIHFFIAVLEPPGTPPMNIMSVLHMRCWVSKYGKKGAWSSFLKEFWDNIKKLRYWS